MEKLLDIMFHHGRTFKKNADGKLVYSPDNKACLGDLDEDRLDVFFIRNYFKELGYDKVIECWWLVPERSLEVGLRALTTDDELREMCFHAQMNDGLVDVYFEHGVSTPELLEGKEDVLCLDYIQQEEPGGELNKKNTPEETLNEKPHDKADPDPEPPTPIPIPNSPTAIPVPTNTSIRKPMHDDTKSMADHENPKLHHISNPKPTTKPNTTPTVNQNPKPKQNQKPKKTQPKPKPKITSKTKPKFNPPKRIPRSQARGQWSANKGKQTFHVDLTGNRSSSDEGSSEDDSYVPVQETSSSSDDELLKQPIRKEVKKVQKASAMAKEKEKLYKDTIMQDDDAIVADLSDVEVDLGFLGSPGGGFMYDALDPVIQSRLEKVRKESKNWVPIWTGDEAYEKFEVHGQPTNMVVDLGKRLCTCQFWMLIGIPCVHACAVLARVNKRPEDFCHPLVTMDSYTKTYEHYINPLPGQSMWEKSAYTDIPPPVSGPQAEEVELSQPIYGGTQDEAPPPPATRPPKLPTKRKTTPQPVTSSVDPMQGATAATASRLERFMKMVPTPQFKAPRKKNP
ncbi:hypothetical protein Ahy_A01g000638 [Arachis hypogaea]|uniref:SWIM-type domain-containing protein n=1 Tax=Arachis hypogaea TaxID=3818 RepID=A0A445EKY1_ARAHY|nr:hypothetical protein Ahy_A01g000638 [Arachis hypogaea]